MEYQAMFGWRRRNDGFEWQEYVRTTILVRRKERRDKIGEARQAALEGVKMAGKRGVDAGLAGGEAAGRGIWKASRSGARAGARAASVGGAWLGKAMSRGSLGAKIGAGYVAQHGGRMARRGSAKLAVAGSAMWRAGVHHGANLGSKLGDSLGAKAGPMLRPELALPVGFVALAALAGLIGEFFARGFSAMVFGLGLLALLSGVFAISCLPNGFAAQSFFAPVGGWLRRAWQLLPAGFVLPKVKMPSVGAIGAGRAGFYGGGAIVAGIAIAGAYWLGFGTSEPGVLPSAPSVTQSAGTTIVKGYAKSLSGDTLRVERTVVKLAGVEAPELGQRCSRKSGGKWACGYSALQALRRITGSHQVTCEIGDAVIQETRAGTCRIGDKDLAVELVSKGHVFAKTGSASAYGTQEGEARTQKLGIWAGEPVRPTAFRAKKWTIAAKKAPKGCPVKGRILSRGKVYLMPWSRKYDRYSIRTRRGDRWFCSEQEALKAGWKPFQRL